MNCSKVNFSKSKKFDCYFGQLEVKLEVNEKIKLNFLRSRLINNNNDNVG